MSDNETGIEGGVTAPVLSGTFSGTVTIATGPDVETVAHELVEKYGQRHAEIAVIMGTQARVVELETFVRNYFAAQGDERRQREEETAQYRVAMNARLERIETAVGRSFWTATAALLAGATAWIRGETRR